MDTATTLRAARERAGLSQTDLAARTGTSQAAISAYERGRKQPSIATLDRLLAATGARLAVVPAPRRAVVPSAAQLARAGRGLEEVLALAEALPVRHRAELRFPRLGRVGARPAAPHAA